MLFNLFIGALAGYVCRFLEEPLSKIIPSKYEMDKPDLRVLTFILLLLAASILIGLANTEGRPFVLLIGGAIGIFSNVLWTLGKEQYDVQKTRMDERKAAAGGSQPVEPRVTPKKTTLRKPAAKKTTTKKTSDS
ncbi:MAG: hypothetical protein AAF429_13830 [Pseudomonadota bacterium]